MTPVEIDRICDCGSLKIIQNDKAGDNLVKFVSFSKDCSGGRSPIASDVSKPFSRGKCAIGFLDDQSVYKLVREWKSSFQIKTNMTEVLDSFVSEYCQPVSEGIIGAVWFSDSSPSLRQFDDIRNGFGNILAYDGSIKEAYEKVDQKNIPYDQSYHIVKDALSPFGRIIGSDVVKLVFIPNEVDKGVISAMKHLGWIVMSWTGSDYESV